MTMTVRVTNESPGSNYQARVRVFGKPYAYDTQQPDIIPPDTEIEGSERILNVGQSEAFYLHSHQYIVVEEIQQ
jgi:hypothetical protein